MSPNNQGCASHCNIWMSNSHLLHIIQFFQCSQWDTCILTHQHAAFSHILSIQLKPAVTLVLSITVTELRTCSLTPSHLLHSYLIVFLLRNILYYHKRCCFCFKSYPTIHVSFLFYCLVTDSNRVAVRLLFFNGSPYVLPKPRTLQHLSLLAVGVAGYTIKVRASHIWNWRQHFVHFSYRLTVLRVWMAQSVEAEFKLAVGTMTSVSSVPALDVYCLMTHSLRCPLQFVLAKKGLRTQLLHRWRGIHCMTGG